MDQLLDSAFAFTTEPEDQIAAVHDGFTVVPLGQGYASMNAPSRKLERDRTVR